MYEQKGMKGMKHTQRINNAHVTSFGSGFIQNIISTDENKKKMNKNKLILKKLVPIHH